METRILNGWKEIAQFMGRGVRTVQRWETIGLPIRRPNARNRSAVVAFSNELQEWLSRPEGELLHSISNGSPQQSNSFRYRTLVVDDDEERLKNEAGLLAREGYEIRIARHGFQALEAMRAGVPDLLISELKMPYMSGFELLWIVRRRFPGVSVIATSEDYTLASLPEVYCDRFLESGFNPSQLFQMVRELLSISPVRATLAKADYYPAWIPRSANGHVMLTCSSCLRSFYAVQRMGTSETIVDKCVHCGVEVRYRMDESQVPEAPRPFAVSKVPNQPTRDDRPRAASDLPHAGFTLVTPMVRNGKG